MATITLSNELEVVDKYNSLITQSLAGDSAYIRAKETIDELFKNGTITESQKAEIISNIIGGIANSITSSSMATAVQWASAEKDIALKKLELEKQLDILAQEKLVKEAQTGQVENATRLAKVESKRMYGTPVFDSEGNVSSLSNEGKVYNDMLLITAQITKTESEDSLINQKVKESYAAVHKIVADTYVNYGNYTYSGLDTTGITTVTPHHGTFETLSDTQKSIAIEQAKGYTYNAWANALTGSASMLGTAIAADLTEFGTGSTGETLLNTVLSAANNLKAASTTVDEAIPS